jgi:hypothetical protein
MRRIILASFFGVVTVAALVACKSGSSTGGGGGTGGATPANVPPKLGRIEVRLNTFANPPGGGGGGSSNTNVSVSFTDSTKQNPNNPTPNVTDEAGTTPVCTPVQIGPCVVTSCVQGTPPAGGYPQSTTPAGNITVTDTKNNATASFTVSNNPGGSNSYYMGNGQLTPTAAVGDSISVTTTGGVVPAFTQSVTVPSDVTITLPTCEGGQCPVSRAAGFTFSWGDGDQGTVVVTLNANGSACGGPSCPGLQSNAECKFDVSAHSATIPTAVLDRFPEPNASFSYQVEDDVELPEGDYVVHVVASSSTNSGTGITLAQ